MVSPDDAIQWKDVAIAGAVLLSGLTTWGVSVFTKRLDKHEKEDRETFKAIFDGQAKVLQAVNDGFRNTDHNLAEIHVKLLERISDVQHDIDKA